MNRNILLTFETAKGYNTYSWFDTIDEVKDFVSTSDAIVELIDCVNCSNARDIDLSELEAK